MQTINYIYSKTSSILFTALLGGLIIFSLPYLINFIYNGDSLNWSLLLIFDLFIFLMLLYIIIKTLIPAVQNKVALELNQTSIISYAKNINIEWKSIEKIQLRSGRSSSSLYITFKYETDHGSHIRIPLGFVQGNDEKIYNTMIVYLKSNK